MANFLAQLSKKAQNLAGRVVNQVNPLDNGRTFKQQTPVNSRSVVGQLTHNGLTNTVGNIAVKPVTSTLAIPVEAARATLGDITGNKAASFAANRRNDFNVKQSLPGLVADQAINAYSLTRNLPDAIRADIRGFQGKAPTAKQQLALNRGLGALNNTVPGQLNRVNEGIMSNFIPGAKDSLKAAGVEDANLAKQLGDVGMGTIGALTAKPGLSKSADLAQAVGKDIKTSYDKRGTIADYDATINEYSKQKADLQKRIQNTTNFRGIETTQRHIDQLDQKIAEYQASRPKLSLKDRVLSPNIGNSSQAVKLLDSPTVPKMSIPESAPSSGMRQRGLASSIIDDPNTAPEVKAGIGELYKVRNTKDLQSRSQNLVNDDQELAMRVFNSDSNSDVGTMIGSQLSKTLSQQGNHEAALQIAQRLAREATNRGQANQALSTWSKLAPESILRFAQSTVNEYNTKAGLVGGRELRLTPEQAKGITDASEALQKLPEGRAKDIATQELLKKVKEVTPASWVKKLATVQTIGQLLNPKTLIRNIVGNGLFNPLEAASQTVAAGLDKGISAFRKSDRTVALPQLNAQLKGLSRGAREQIEELQRGVNLGPDTQFDISSVPVFRSKAMQSVEKAMGFALRVPDRAAFTAAYDDTVQGLMKANKLKEPTQAILDQAEMNGLYRTFQDNSKAAQLFTQLKKAFNAVGIEGKDGARFGLGDLILKYPKTPGNLIGRGLDYSPVGILGGILKAASNKVAGRPFDQAALVNSIGRGTVGTGALIGSGAALGALGIITEKPSEDADTRNLQKASGQGGYQINTTALLRFVKSGFDKEAAQLQESDTLVSYDWAQPASIPLSTGAAIGKKQSPKDAAVSTVAGISDGLNTLIEQPLVTGVNTFASNIKNKGLVGALGETAKGLPASFVPTISNQARQLTDNTQRNTYSDNVGQQVVQSIENKIPGLSKRVLPRVGPLGNDNEVYQNGSNNVGNVLFNPAFVSKYQPKDAAKLPLDIFKNTGETKQNPLTPKTKQKVNGEDMKLTPKQNSDFAKYIGTKTNEAYNKLSKDAEFKALPQSDQAKKLSGILSDINAAAKIDVLGDKPKDTSVNTKAILQNKTPNWTDPSIASSLGKTSKDFLTKYNALNAEEKKKNQYSQNDYDYQVAQAQFENDKANSKLSKAQLAGKQTDLQKAKVGSKFSKDVREIYGSSKQEIYDIITNDENGKQLAADLDAYDQALKVAGISTSLKFKYGFTPPDKTASGSRRATSTTSNNNLSSRLSLANKLAGSGKGIKARKVSLSGKISGSGTKQYKGPTLYRKKA